MEKKKKKRRPYYIAGLVLVSMGALTYYLISEKHISFDSRQTDIIMPTQTSSVDISAKKIKPFLRNDPILTIQKPKVMTADTSKSLETQKNTNNDVMIPTLPVVDEIPMVNQSSKIQKHENSSHTVTRQVIQAPKEIQKPHKKMHLNIIKTANASAYDEVEKRFNQFRDPDDALFLARMYYKKGAYTKSESWALKTNKIDQNIEESWIIFAKSKIKQGNLDEARAILFKYIRQSSSQEAKTLLQKISK